MRHIIGNVPSKINLLNDIKDGQFQTAILLGLASIPFTIGVNWLLTPDPLSVEPLFFACVTSGYMYGSRSMSETRAGTITGIVGGFPVLLFQSGSAFTEVWGNPILVEITGESWIMTLTSIGAVGVTFVVLAVILVIIGIIGGIVGGLINDGVKRLRSGVKNP